MRKEKRGGGEETPSPHTGHQKCGLVWVGKEFPDMRQNEREIKFIRMGDTVRTVDQLKGEPTLNRGLQSTFIPRVQGVG